MCWQLLPEGRVRVSSSVPSTMPSHGPQKGGGRLSLLSQHLRKPWAFYSEKLFRVESPTFFFFNLNVRYFYRCAYVIDNHWWPSGRQVWYFPLVSDLRIAHLLQGLSSQAGSLIAVSWAGSFTLRAAPTQPLPPVPAPHAHLPFFQRALWCFEGISIRANKLRGLGSRAVITA